MVVESVDEVIDEVVVEQDTRWLLATRGNLARVDHQGGGDPSEGD
jgi:hypothetical protein